MRSREPLLYEQYIGQYLTDEEVMIPQVPSHVQLTWFYFRSEVFFKNLWLSQILERSQEAMQGNAEETTGSSTAGLAHLLLNSYQEHLIQNRLQEEQEREEGAEEEEEEEDEENEDGRSKSRVETSLLSFCD